MQIAKKFLLLAVALVAAATPLRAADDTLLKKLRAADDERVAAIIAADRARLTEIFSDDLRYAHSTGAVDTKASYIDSLVSGRTKYVVYDYQERNFTFPTPGIALMTGRVHIKATSATGTSDGVLSILAVWREEKGRWRFLAWQSCKLPMPEKDAKLAPPNASATNVSLKEFVHPPVNFKPGPEYGPGARNYQGIPGIERAPGGRLWAVWYAGKVWEDKYNYVVTATSGDDGQTWSDLKFVLDPDGDGPMRASDPCFWLDPSGRLWLFWWLNGPGELKTVTMAMTTDNPDAESPQWSAPRVICTGVMLNKPIVTRAGEWIFPTAIWQTDGSCRAMVSTDKGRSWTLRGTANVPKAQRNCDEPMIAERRDGSLWQLVRTVFGIGQSVSQDGGRTWTEFTDYLPNATSRFYLRRLASGNFLLVKHGPLDKKIGRSQLTAYLSDDDGATWKGGLVLDERDSVSYPDGTQSPDGTIRVIYDWERGRDKHILMAVFTEADVLAGKFASAAARSRVLINQATGINPRIFPNGKPTPDTNGGALLTGPAAGLESTGSETGVFEPGAKIFLNRTYAVKEAPEALRDCKFIRGNLEAVRAVCRQAGVVFVVTATAGRNPDSRAAVLLERGFQKVNLPEFLLFGADQVSVYQKQVAVGDTLDFGKWVVLVLPDKTR